MAETLDGWFFAGRQLEQLPAGCRFVFNAANVTTGVRFGFERDVYGDYVTGRTTTRGSGVRVADAVAASAAVPGPFSPLKLDADAFPCGAVGRPKLLDGYDNLGLEPLTRLRDAFLIALSAGGVFRTGRYGWVPLVRELKRSEGLLYRQATALRTRTMVDRFQAYERATKRGEPVPDFGRYGVLFGLASSFDPVPEWIMVSASKNRHNDWADLRLVKDDNLNYIGGSPFGNGQPQPGETLWGKRVVVTTAISAGSALVGAFGTAATIFRRGVLTVEASNSHEDFFRRDLVAIRAETRLALAVLRPESLVLSDLGYAS